MSSSQMMSSNRPNNSQYSKKEYWDDRYTTEESYEWFVGYEPIRHLLRQYVKKTDRVLILGCGNSALSVDMYKDGIHCITNIDYSSTCIERMSARHQADMPEMTWLEMDAQKLQFDDGSFDVVLEKGMFDALMVVEKSPWFVSTETRQCFDRILTEVSRVLGVGGHFISITFAQPHFRIPLYAQPRYDWSLIKDEINTTGCCLEYFCYTMTKGGQLTTGQTECAEKFFSPPVTSEGPIVMLEDTETELDFLKISL